MIKNKRLTSWGLHLVAMALMLCDHLWGTVISGNDWLTMVGRLAFPIFAFMLAEGYYHTKDYKKYLTRMVIFALISELPFNLMHEGTLIYPFQQNVLWTFVLALLAMRWIDRIIQNRKPWLAVILTALVVGLFYVLGLLTMVDYFGHGVLMALLFFFAKKVGRFEKAVQLFGLIYINCFMMKGLVYPVELFGFEMNIPQQAFAVLGILPIWFYGGEKGTSNKLTRTVNYWFYPVHMLILGLIAYLI